MGKKKKRRKKPKYDFLFIDESGDPGPRGTWYYICTVLHVNDLNIKHLYSTICNFRFLFDRYDELCSYHLSDKLLKRLSHLIKKKRRYFNCSCVFLNKNNYRGPYLHKQGRWLGFHSQKFRKYIYRQVLDLHFQKFKLDSSNVELVVDRSDLSQEDIKDLEKYLNRWSDVPRKLDHLTPVDSKYVELVQLADLVCGHYKLDTDNKFFKKQGFSYSFINSKDITLESSSGEKYLSKP